MLEIGPRAAPDDRAGFQRGTYLRSRLVLSDEALPPTQVEKISNQLSELQAFHQIATFNGRGPFNFVRAVASLSRRMK